MERAQGILYAALSSSTFGLAPLFTLLLLAGGYSPFEALSYRWGVAALFLGVLAVFSGRSLRLGRRELVTVFLLSLFRAATSLSLIIAYQHIASGVASTIHFMYPLAVALAMMCFFREKGSAWVFAADGRRHRRRGLRRTLYRAGGRGDSADRGRRERRRPPHRPPAAIGVGGRLSGRTDFAARRRQICAGKGREETPA